MTPPWHERGASVTSIVYTAHMPSKVHMLGRLGVFDGNVWHHPPSHKTVACLTYLAHEGVWVERQKLAALFWPEADEVRARSNLRSLIARSRRLPFAEDLAIERTRMRWSVDCDVHAFRSAVEAERWQDALACYRGPLLADRAFADTGGFEAWLQLQRVNLADAHRTAAMHRARELHQADRTAEALASIESLLKHDDLHEEAVRFHMRLVADSGRPTQALRAFQAFRARLAEELSLEPSATTTALADSIRTNVAASVSVGRAVERTPVPTPLTSFIGREAEIAEATARLAQPDCRMLTIVGAGGVGKTRLALRAAQELAARYEHGVGFVSLESVRHPHEIPDAIASSLGVALSNRHDTREELVRAIAQRNMLLVLDNFEHLLHGTTLVSRILAACDRLDALVTSRERLGIAEESLLRLGGLPYPQVPVAFEAATEYGAVRFLLARIHQVRPDFQLDTAVLPDALEICRLVDGLPLALELAAVWARAVPLDEIAAEIAENLDFLDRGSRATNNRHRSIRATLNVSWNLLTEPEQDTLRRLAVFESGFRRAGAAYVANGSITMLAALIDKSWLRASLSGRYDRHPLVQAFTREKLAERPATSHEASLHHAEYFVSVLEEAEPHMGTARENAWRSRLAIDRENIVAALDWALHHNRGDLALQLAPAMRWLGMFGENLREGRKLLSQVLEASPAVRSPLRARVLHLASVLALSEGDLVAGRSAIEAGLDMIDSESAPISVFKFRNNLAHIARMQGDYALARAHLEICLELDPKMPDRARFANALNNLGAVARIEGDLSRAADLHREALEIGRMLQSELVIAQASNGLGYLARDRGDIDLARRWLEESLGRARDHGLTYSRIASLHELGRFARERGELALAHSHHLEAVTVEHANGVRRIRDTSLEAVAEFLAGTDRVEKALRLWGAAEAFRVERATRLTPRQCVARDRHVARAQHALGGDRFEIIYLEGLDMGADDALRYALHALEAWTEGPDGRYQR